MISNLVAHVLDMHLVRLASTVGCTYSRYADDLTFSTNKSRFPAEIAKLSDTEPHLWVPGAELQRLIAHSGFRINPAKTHMQYRTSRQEVTGLVVNRKINVRREYRHTVRAIVHSLLNKGTFETYAAVEKAGTVTAEKRLGTANQLHGMLGFIDTIHRYNKDTLHDIRPSSNDSMYRRAIARNSVESQRPSTLLDYAAAAWLASGFRETVLAKEASSSGISRNPRTLRNCLSATSSPDPTQRSI